MPLPNFLIIGVVKGGTSSLYHYLKDHPEVYVNPFLKEARFFAYDENNPQHKIKSTNVFPIRTMADYLALFKKVSNEKAIGEVSPNYIQSSTAVKRIKEYIPNARLIVSLRNPVDRTYSDYIQYVRNEHILQRSFVEILNENDKWVRMSLYYQDLKRYYQVFDREKIKVILFDDLIQDALNTAREVYRFLDVDDTFVPDVSTIYNQGGIPRNKNFHAFLRFFQQKNIKKLLMPVVPQGVRSHYTELKKRNLEKAPPLPSDIRHQWAQFYREDILRTQDLVRLDLSRWLQEH